jgi:hypothetical protein
MTASLVLATGFAFAELDSPYAGAASADSTDTGRRFGFTTRRFP